MPLPGHQRSRHEAVEARHRELFAGSLGGVAGIEGAEVSPDGALVAAIVRIMDEVGGHGHTELHVLATDGTRRWTVTGPDGDAQEPRWSPDGGTLAFVADHGTRHRAVPWTIPMTADGPAGEPRPLASPPGIVEHLRYAPDGARLLLVMAGEGAEQADGLGSGTLGQDAAHDEQPAWYPEVETSRGDDEWRTLWSLDLADGESRRASPDGLNVWEAAWLGPGAAVAVVSDAAAEDAWYGARVARIDLSTGTVTTLYQPTWQVQFLDGSPDGRWAAVIEAVASDRYFVAGDCVLLDAAGTVRPLPVDGVDVSAVRWIGCDRLAVLGTTGMQSVSGVLDVDGAWQETWRGDPAHGGLYARISPSGTSGALATMLDGPSEPGRLVIIENGRERTLLGTRNATSKAGAAALAVQRVESWTGRDGTRIEGLLRLPHGRSPFATILLIHGGPVGAVGQEFPLLGDTILLEAGYAILTPNPRGSTGRGREFAAAVVGDMGGEDAYDLLAGVDHLVTSGVADPDRLVVAGVSYGGYMAALLPTLDDRFAAAIVGSPLTDLVSSYYGSSLTRFVHDFVGGRPATETERYLERSPVFAGPRLRTPTLITTGLRDRATPVGQATELFRALREQGTDTELVVYPLEGHGVRDWAARADWVARVVTWMERYAPPR